MLVDFRLTDWPEREGVSLALRPMNGLALCVLLRELRDDSRQGRLTAFALHSAHLDQVRGRLPPGTGEHLIARLNNLEWAFSKSSGVRWSQMVSLATAVRRLPRRWPDVHSDAQATALNLLGLTDDVSWFDRAWRNVRACQPPIHDLREGAHGLLFVRWLLHQILPYPCFLWREEWVAARLRLTLSSLRDIIREGAQLSKDLAAMNYGGLLTGFLGPRWWRGALEEYVWGLTEGRALDVATLHGALRERTKVAFEALPPDASVVCQGRTLEPTGDFIAPADAVRLRPDQWPPFADDAWTSLLLAREDAFLADLADPLESSRIGDSGTGAS